MSAVPFFFSELHAKNYRFQPCAFLKFTKISGITSVMEIPFYRSRRSQIRFAEYLFKAVLWKTSRKDCKCT